MQPNRAVTEDLDVKQRMRAEQDGRAALLDFHDAVKRAPSKSAITNRQGFVDDQHIRVNAGGDGKRQAHMHAAGIGLDRLIDVHTDVGEGNDLVDFLVDLALGQTQRGSVEIDIFATCEVKIEARTEFEQGSNSAMRLERTTAWRYGSGNELQQRGFARAVDTDDTQHLALLQAEVDIGDGRELLEVLPFAAPQNLPQAV